jgi:PAS domain S-box-containing protein
MSRKKFILSVTAALILAVACEILFIALLSPGSAWRVDRVIDDLIVVPLIVILLYVHGRSSAARRSLQETLEEREVDYRYLFTNNPLPMWIYDRATRAFLEVNQAAERIYGYTREQFLAMRIDDIRPPEDIPRLKAVVENRGSGYQNSGEWRHRLRDGSIREVEVIGHALDYLGRAAALIVSFDITQRKQVERSLRQSETRLQAVFAASPMAITVVNPAWEIELLNPAMVSLYGWEARELLGDAFPFIPPDRRGEIAELRRRLTEGEIIRNLETVRQHRDGRLMHVSISGAPLRDDEGQISGYIVMTKDITARKQDELALKAALAEVRDLSDALDQAAIVAKTDVKGRIIYVNDKFCEISGYAREELLGQDHRMINSGYHSSDFIRDLWRTIANGQVWRGELRNRTKDGSVYWVDTTIVPMLDERGKPHQYIAIRYDITERKRLEAETLEQERLRVALDKEIEQRKMRDQVMRMLSHDLRTPLTTIRSSAELIQFYSDRMDDDRRARHFEMIQAQVSHMIRMMDDLLTLQRADSGGLQFRPVAADLVAFVRDLVEESQAGASIRHDLKFEAQIEQQILPLDTGLLRHAVGNLIANAIKYSPEGGRVWVRIYAASAQWVSLSVRDEGIGIPPEDRERLFEAFHRGSNVGRIHGTGLGLAIAQQTALLHGGTLDVESEVGAGSTFTLTLPVGRSSQMGAAS